MSLKCGIVGLPNVGKSTFFNAMSSDKKAEAANYPFCTIEPNSARVALKDERLLSLAKIASSAEIIPNYLDIMDIAGLVRGASKGEGLGNKFLSHIRETDAIIHVVRAFSHSDIIHVENSVDPIRDIEIINTELMLADLEVVESRIDKNAKKAKGGDKEAILLDEILRVCKKALDAGTNVREVSNEFAEFDQKKLFNSLNLITAKPVVYVANVLEGDVASGNDFSKQVEEYAKKSGSHFLLISAQIEGEISQMETEEERSEFIKMIGLEDSGLNKVVMKCFGLLDLITYFTIGPKEARAWTIKNGTLAPQAAGVIHTDFEKGFIRAEVVSYADYLKYSGEAGAKEAGRFRLEGKEYKVADGDVLHFRFNV